MPTEIYLVKVGMSMTEGVVEEWYISDGGSVSVGELLYRLETEKVNLDVDAEVAGTVRHLVDEGVTLLPGDVVGYIFAAGEVIPQELPKPTVTAAAAIATAAVPEAESVLGVAVVSDGRRASPIARRLARERNIELSTIRGTGTDGRIVEADVLAQPPTQAASVHSGEADGGQPSSPMARKLARELGVDLETVTGTGPGGRITRQDVEALVAAAPTAPIVSAASAAPAAPAADKPALTAQVLPLSGMRRTIARRMRESLQSMAQLTMDMDVIMDDAIKLRDQLIEEWQARGVRPSYTDLVVRAVTKALANHPRMNARLADTEIHLLGEINIGIAVALDDGLLVPVVRHADQLNLESLVAESGRLAQAAKARTLSIDELQDGTFTVSALGMFGVDSFTPIINAPQAGILGINRIRDDIAWANAVPVKQRVMRLSLTWDHRVLDGAPAAEFLAEIRDLLEAPYRLLV